MKRPVFLHRTVLKLVDGRRGDKSRAEFIAQAVAHELGRQAVGGGVIAPASGFPRFTPRGLLGKRSEPLFPCPDMDFDLSGGSA